MTVIGSGRARSRKGRRIALALSTILMSGLAAPALAQTALPPYVNTDENGVDLTDGDFKFSLTEGSIGAGEAELRLQRNYQRLGMTDSLPGELFRNGSAVSLTFGLTSETFVLTAGTWVPSQGNGATLTFTSGGSNADTFTYVSAEGVTIVYTSPTGSTGGTVPGERYCGNGYTSDCLALPLTITQASGRKITLDWRSVSRCAHTTDCSAYYRLSAVSNESGYMVKFKYVSNAVPPSGPSNDWYVRATAKFINLANDYCDPSANDCDSTSLSWPVVSYAHPSASVDEITDIGGGTWRVTKGVGGVTGIRRPGEGSDSTTVTYGVNGVTNVTRDGVSTGYSRTLTGTNQYTTVRTDALSNTRTVVADMAKYRPVSITNEAAKTTSYAYDSSGRLTESTAPEGNKTQFAYDARGNITTTTLKAKSGSGLSDIVTTASYPSTCTYPVSCNKPDWTKDALNNQTDYTWDTTTGNLLTVTLPAASGGGTRPKTTYGYTSLEAYFKNSGGTIVASGRPVSLRTSTSICVTGSTCAGTADEVKTTFAYGSTGVANNLFPTSVTRGAGDASLLATTAAAYDRFGNIATVDGPLSGTDDTTTFRYDGARNLVGVINPDPDGGGSLKRRAQKTTYNTLNQVTQTEAGTVNGTSDGDWTAFVSLQQSTATYDANHRKTKDVVTASSTTYQVTQYSYDVLGRLECTGLRMNSAEWGSLPSSACTLDTEGSFGPDRIAKRTFDAVGRVSKITSGYGTAAVADDVTSTFTNNGQPATFADAENNKTTYEYDGHDRLLKTRFPSTTKGAGTSSATDYEQLTYDANGNVTSRRLRDATSIGYTFDNLGSMTAKNLPGSEPDVTYSYDLLGRMTGASQTGNALTFGFDALNRNISQVGPLGTVTYLYDAAGRRTRTTWPDTFYVSYDYLVTGEVTHIRENGAGSGVGVLAAYAYDDLGRRTSLTRGNGAVTNYAFDNVSRLTSLAQNLSSTSNDVTTTFGHNPGGQIATQTRDNDIFSYTGANNGSFTDTINGLNQATAAGGISLGYDARGNLNSYGGYGSTYSSENLLTVAPGGITLAYDPALRLYQLAGGTTTRFQYDGFNMIGEYNGSNVLQKRYVHGPSADEPLVEYAGTGTSSRTFLHADERGSIVAHSDGTGALVSGGINRYDQYGLRASSNTGRFQYTGQMWLTEVGVYYYKARMYAPNLGRFLQTDPIGYGADTNLYAYVRGDPVNFKDPTGLLSRCYTEYYESASRFENLPGGLVPRLVCPPGAGSGSEGVDFSGGGGALSGGAKNKRQCGRGGRITLSPYGFGGTGFLFIGGFSVGAEAGVSIPLTALQGDFRGMQLYGSASFVQLVGLGAFFGGGTNVGVGYTPGPISTGVSTLDGSSGIRPTLVVQSGAAVKAGVEGQLQGDESSIGLSGGGGPRVGYGLYSAAGIKHSITAATPELCY